MQELGSGSLPFLYNDFHGGLNTKDAADLLTDNQSRDLSNVQGTTAGWIVKRNGLSTFATPAVTLNDLFSCEATPASFLVGSGSTNLYSVSASGTIATIATGLTAGKRWEFVSAPVIGAQGPLFGMNGTDTPKQWTGTGTAGNWINASGGVAVPNGKYCIFANNQVFVSGVAANPSRLFWSAIADPTNWDPASLKGAGWADFDPNDGQVITAIGIVGPYIFVAKPRKIFLLIDAATASIRRLANNVGCVAHRSLATGPEGTFFLAEDRGVYLTNGSKLTPIADVIQPTIDSIQPGLRGQAAGAVFGAHYYLSVPLLGATNDTTLDYDTTLSSWWKHSFGSNQFAIWHSTGTALLYSAKATAAFVDQAFASGATTDNGNNFAWVWRGPWQSPTFYRRRRFPTPYFRKRQRQIRVGGSGQVDFSIAKDFTPTETLIRSDMFKYLSVATTGTFAGAGTFAGTDGSVWGGQAGSTRARIYAGIGVANAFSVVFSGTNASPAAINSYVLMLTDRRDLVVS